MNFQEKLKRDYNKHKSIVCMGMDPLLEKIPIKEGNTKEKIYRFYAEILNEIVRTGNFPSCVKPNYAFYARYGFEGLEALFDLIELYKKNGLTVILDSKRGDIGTTAEAYADEAFHFFKADAVTLSPYLGFDSIEPFIRKYPDAGYYVLCKTSNKSSGEIQDVITEGKPLYEKVAEKLSSWKNPGIGAVAGATYPEQLLLILETFKKGGQILPLLIPGIGTQGGDLKSVINIISKYDISLHRINASSSINFAYIKTGKNFAEAASLEIKKMNEEINEIMESEKN